jgi:Dna[CI] antecedent, DciA
MTSNTSDQNRSRFNQPQILAKWISTQHELQKLAPALAELSVFQSVIDKVYPLLMLQALSLKDEVLVVSAPSPSVAAKLRQSSPSLVAAINSASQANPHTSGRKVNRIRFKPQMGFSGKTSHREAKKGLTGRGKGAPEGSSKIQLPANSIAVAQHMIEHCDNEKLKFALTRLINRQKKTG